MSTSGSLRSENWLSGAEEGLDRAPLVHRAVALGDVLERQCQVEDLAGIDLVFNGTINPGKVFDLVLPLAQVAEGYRAMDERRAIKTLLQP